MYRVAIFGNNHLAVLTTQDFHLHHQDIEVVALIPEARDLVDKSVYDGKWEQSFSSFAGAFVAENESTRLFTGNINKFAHELAQLDLDLLVGCRSSALVKKKVLDIPRIGTTNIHFGDLPRYGGCHTIQHAILNGEEHVGCTFHFMSEEFDAGDVIAKELVPIAGKTAFAVYTEASAVGHRLVVDNIHKALRKECRPQVGERLYFKADSIDFQKDGIIDLSTMSEEEADRKFRAFYFPPFQLPKILVGDKILEIAERGGI